MWRVISPLPVGDQHNTELKKHVWGLGNSTALWGKQCIALPWRETRSNLKLTVSPREKFIPNSEACPVSGRGWQVIIHQLLTGPPLRSHMFQRVDSTKEAQDKSCRARSPPKLLHREV
jgi:hypothetical protein